MGEYRVKKSKTFRLFAVPSFSTGFSFALNLFPSNSDINESKSITEADMKAIKADFEMIGKDLKDSVDEWEKATIK